MIIISRPSLLLPLLLVTLAGCETKEGSDPGKNGAAAAEDSSNDAQPAAIGGVMLPQGWAGEGVLAQRTSAVPQAAPSWTRVRAEVVREGETRALIATGSSRRIKNRSLARITAENRARAELARWIASTKLPGTQIIDFWFDPGSGVNFARARLVVPEDWSPGGALPTNATAGTAAPTR